MEHLPETPEYNEGLDEYIKPLGAAISLLREPLENFESADAWFVGTRATIIQLEETYKESSYWGKFDPQVLCTRACTRLLKEAPTSAYAREARWYLDSILKDAFELPEGQHMSYQLKGAIEMEIDRRAATNSVITEKERASLEAAMKGQDMALGNINSMSRYLTRIRKKSASDDSDPKSKAWKLASLRVKQDGLEDKILSSDDTVANKRKALMRLAVGKPQITIMAHYSAARRAYNREIGRLEAEFFTNAPASE